VSDLPRPPRVYDEFTDKFPKLAEAWAVIAEAGKDGPMTPREARIAKLALAIGAQRQGSVHAAVRKGSAAGMTAEDFSQILALAAGTIGMPSVVAAFTWVEDELKKQT
jgi:4-carboxymuconolactone decarboxylase